jgi:DNA-binding MarR family transcriptional regulator
MDARPDTATEAEADRLLFAVFNEIGIIEQLARTRFEAAMPDGLLMPHFIVLNHLVRLGDDKSLKSLAFAFQVSKGAMTNTIQRLERRGFVDVKPDPRDGRGKRVFITDAGRAVRAEAIRGLAPAFRALAQDPGLTAFEAVLPHLETIRRSLDAMRDAGRSEAHN